MKYRYKLTNLIYRLCAVASIVAGIVLKIITKKNMFIGIGSWLFAIFTIAIIILQRVEVKKLMSILGPLDEIERVKYAEENKKKKLENLLNTSFELFTSQGLTKTSISDIVEKAGVAKGTFYLYFKDK